MRATEMTDRILKTNLRGDKNDEDTASEHGSFCLLEGLHTYNTTMESSFGRLGFELCSTPNSATSQTCPPLS